MSNYEPEAHQHSQQDQQHQHDGEHYDSTMDTLLEARITRTLHEQASHVHFTPASRAQVMAHITSHRSQRRRLTPIFTLATVAVLLLALGTLLVQSLYHHSSGATSAFYTLHSTINTPVPLAHNGQLVSLDPTGQHIVYQAAASSGIMYTADVKNPDASNTLAMRDAETASWSPDGSKLVAIIKSGNASESFLALIQLGSYMTPLGHSAIAASWSPTNQVVYATQANSMTQLFATTPQPNQPAHLLATLNIAQPIHSLVWSPDGRTLALIAGSSNSNGTSYTIYLVDMQRYTMRQLVTPGDFTVSFAAWSPNSHYFSYERIDVQGKETIETREVSNGRIAFTITPESSLTGWSWSPSSNAIIYSDSGILSAHVLNGTAITFARSPTREISPLWLPDGRILCINVVHNNNTLTILSSQTHT